MSVRPLVGWSVHHARVEKWENAHSAPAHPSATGGRVSGLVCFFVSLFISLFVSRFLLSFLSFVAFLIQFMTDVFSPPCIFVLPAIEFLQFQGFITRILQVGKDVVAIEQRGRV